MKVSLNGKTHAEALVRLFLYAKSNTLAASVSHVSVLSTQMAKKTLQESTYVDYLYGRVIKTDFVGDELDSRLYDRDNGDGAMKQALEGKGSVI